MTEALEYVITRPDTPLPWINYLGTADYFGIISNTAGGYSFYKDARLRRLTRYRYNNAPLDAGGRYIYLRDNAAPTPHRSGRPPGSPPAHRWMRTSAGMAWDIPPSAPGLATALECSLRYFVPLGAEPGDLAANPDQPAFRAMPTFRLFSAVEFCLWDAVDDSTNFQRNYSIGEVEVWTV